MLLILLWLWFNSLKCFPFRLPFLTSCVGTCYYFSFRQNHQISPNPQISHKRWQQSPRECTQKVSTFFAICHTAKTIQSMKQITSKPRNQKKNIVCDVLSNKKYGPGQTFLFNHPKLSNIFRFEGLLPISCNLAKAKSKLSSLASSVGWSFGLCGLGLQDCLLLVGGSTVLVHSLDSLVLSSLT